MKKKVWFRAARLLQLDQQLLRFLPPPLLHELVLFSATHAAHASITIIVFF
jgi:hypothetical protein